MVGGSSFLTTKKEREDPPLTPPYRGRGANITGKTHVEDLPASERLTISNPSQAMSGAQTGVTDSVPLRGTALLASPLPLL